MIIPITLTLGLSGLNSDLIQSEAHGNWWKPMNVHRERGTSLFRICRIFLCMMALFWGTTGLARVQPSEVGVDVEAKRGIVKNIAVYAFIPDGPQQSPDTDFLSEWLSQCLSEFFDEQKSIRILERQKLSVLLAELKIGTSDLADEKTRLRLGRLLGVDYFVFGSFLKIGDQILVSGHLVNTESGIVVTAADSDGDKWQLKPIVQRLSAKLLSGLGLDVQEESLGRAELSTDREIIRELYDKGLALERTEDIRAAIECYQEILKRENDNPWAKQAIQRLMHSPATFDHCPGGQQRIFIVSAVKSRVEDSDWHNHLIALGLSNLAKEEMFATGCYLPAETDDETKTMIEELVIGSWKSGKSTSTGRLHERLAVSYDTEVELIVKSFTKERSRIMFGPFSRGKATVKVVVQIAVKSPTEDVQMAEGTGKGVTRAKGTIFTIRSNRVHFDASSVGIAVHEAIREAVKSLMER